MALLLQIPRPQIAGFHEFPVTKGDRTTHAQPGAGVGQLALNFFLRRCRDLNGGGVIMKVTRGGWPSRKQVEILGQGHQKS